jgi:hypothetical protein
MSDQTNQLEQLYTIKDLAASQKVSKRKAWDILSEWERSGRIEVVRLSKRCARFKLKPQHSIAA